MHIFSLSDLPWPRSISDVTRHASDLLLENVLYKLFPCAFAHIKAQVEINVAEDQRII
jgi:hypothetical protein